MGSESACSSSTNAMACRTPSSPVTPAVNTDGRVLAVAQTGLVESSMNAADTTLPPSSLVIAEVRVRR